jgi:DNA helicase-2/ATP-dependent DNA helicase PcrA
MANGLLDGLNPEQRRAVETTDGPVLVLAGAGSGKTRVITRRIAWLLSKRAPARSLLAVTFTNKAAREMRERVAGLVGPVAKELTVSTFHSFCARVLRQHAERMGLSRNFTICDDSDQQTAVKGALRELRIAEATVHPRAALSRISLFKNSLVSPEQALDRAADDFDELVARAYKSYDAQLRRSRTVDFDDLLVLTGRLLSGHAEVRAAYVERYRHLMVDEYQDTNGPQYEILRLLAGKARNVCVVGDDDQSIYGWRGADVRKILNFERDFPGAAVIRLETNYRSTPQILEAANKVISNNASRHEKKLKASCPAGEPVRVLEMMDEEHEAEFVVDEIARAVRKGEARLGEFAVLFRTQVQPRTFEARLRAARLPYELVGGMSFFDRKEVRDVLAYLRLAANPFDEASLLRVVNVPPRGVGKAAIERIVDAATKEGISAAAVFDREGVAAPFRKSLAAAASRVGAVGLVTAVRELILAVNYAAEVEKCYPDAVARQARWAAVEEIFNLAENHVRRTEGATLETFLEELTLSAEEREETEEEGKARERVTLMTLHAAKGLEFDRVWLVGVEEGLLPHARSIAENTVEEERRLMYVGITRARRALAITRCRTRAKYGKREMCTASRFLFELKGEVAPFVKPPVEPTAPKRRGAAKKPAKARSR